MIARLFTSCTIVLLVAGCAARPVGGLDTRATVQSIQAAYALDFQGLAFVAQETARTWGSQPQ